MSDNTQTDAISDAPLPVAAGAPNPITRVLAHAIHVGDRIDATGIARGDMIATVPFATRLSATKFIALYRFGVIVSRA
jgi:hypothetical protein